MNSLKTYEFLNLTADKFKFAKETKTLNSDSKSELLMQDRKMIELIPAVQAEIKTMDEGTKDKLTLQFGEIFFKIFSE